MGWRGGERERWGALGGGGGGSSVPPCACSPPCLSPPPPSTSPPPGTVELNTFFLIARRQWRPVRTLASWLYWGTFIPMRLLLYPYLLAVFYREMLVYPWCVACVCVGGGGGGGERVRPLPPPPAPAARGVACLLGGRAGASRAPTHPPCPPAPLPPLPLPCARRYERWTVVGCQLVLCGFNVVLLALSLLNRRKRRAGGGDAKKGADVVAAVEAAPELKVQQRPSGLAPRSVAVTARF